jgi:hypothetical protein
MRLPEMIRLAPRCCGTVVETGVCEVKKLQSILIAKLDDN